ncbi:MAG: biotin/lipoate A/B protein ligase family protein [Sulfurimonas sp.]|uniref:lipoate--protein ligase family protein n=1 Tax=Sulfurimonas sp. TaxID=2022749 RepID=UPI003D0FE4DD
MFNKKRWRFIDTHRASAEWNMAVDEALLRNFGDDNLPILRLYSWQRALSLGRFSDAKKSIDFEQLDKGGISMVRRISGGGILAHDNELSYSLIFPRRFLQERGVKESYRHLCSFLLLFYQKLGFEAQFAAEAGVQSRHSDICLAGVEAYDILIEGKKIGGNAQRHTKMAVLQHGTIPISFDKVLFTSLFLEHNGFESAATLKEFGVDTEQTILHKILLDSFCETFHVETSADELSVSEKQSVNELLKKRYTKSEWNNNGSTIYS